jgi:hypothetical protein
MTRWQGLGTRLFISALRVQRGSHAASRRTVNTCAGRNNVHLSAWCWSWALPSWRGATSSSSTYAFLPARRWLRCPVIHPLRASQSIRYSLGVLPTRYGTIHLSRWVAYMSHLQNRDARTGLAGSVGSFPREFRTGDVLRDHVICPSMRVIACRRAVGSHQ